MGTEAKAFLSDLDSKFAPRGRVVNRLKLICDDLTATASERIDTLLTQGAEHEPRRKFTLCGAARERICGSIPVGQLAGTIVSFAQLFRLNKAAKVHHPNSPDTQKYASLNNRRGVRVDRAIYMESIALWPNAAMIFISYVFRHCVFRREAVWSHISQEECVTRCFGSGR